MILNEKNIKITKTEIYPSIFSYTLPEGYHFESYGTDYGNVIFGAEALDNPYIVKKDETVNNDNFNDNDNKRNG